MPLTLSDTLALLRELGQNPRGSLGQNFLIDGNIVEKSVALAEVDGSDTIVEVGPGLGTLTRALLSTGATVYAVELDLKLHAYLSRTLAAEYPKTFHPMQGDAVEFPLAGLPEGVPFKIVANLPYSISSPWMEALFSHSPLPSRMVLMLQREAVERYMAACGTKNFGAISIFVQAAFERGTGHKVSASCFYPRPEVGNVLFNLSRKSEPHVFPPESREKIRKVFQQRRKQLGSLCKRDAQLETWLSEIVQKHGLDPKARPEDVPVKAWEMLG